MVRKLRDIPPEELLGLSDRAMRDNREILEALAEYDRRAGLALGTEGEPTRILVPVSDPAVLQVHLENIPFPPGKATGRKRAYSASLGFYTLTMTTVVSRSTTQVAARQRSSPIELEQSIA